MENKKTQQQQLIDAPLQTIPVIEEFIQIDKKIVEKATVHIRKNVSEETVSIPLLTSQDHYEVERIPMNTFIEEIPPPYRQEGDTIIIPVLVEETIIQKRYKLVEEVRLTKTIKDTVHNQEITLKKETITINRTVTKNEDV
jgi:uncharacterized protein (TIGR02271 family)